MLQRSQKANPGPFRDLESGFKAILWVVERSRADIDAARAHPDEDYFEVFSRMLQWHAAYTFALCGMVTTHERGAWRMFKSPGIQDELRRAVLLLTEQALGL
jgi:hypothetical protein